MKANPLATSNYGTFEDRQRLLKNSIKDFFSVGTILTLFFIVADFVPLYTKWNSVQQENFFFVIMLSLVSAVTLDLPMLIAGRALREYHDGLRKKKNMLFIFIPSVCAFFLVYIPYFIFSFVTKDSVFEPALPLSSSTVAFGTSTATASNPHSVSIAALFSGIMPLGTSIASLVTGIFMYNPAKEKLRKLKRAKLLAQEHRAKLEQGLCQVTDLNIRMSLLEARERDLFEIFQAEVKAQEITRILAFQEALEEKLKDDETGILHIIENASLYLETSNANDSKPFLIDQINELNSESESAKEMPTIYSTTYHSVS